MFNRFQAVFKSFQENNVRYLVIGGIAAILYGVPRATFDLDILIDPTLENGSRLLKALSEQGFATASMIDVGELLANEITVFKDFLRLDVQTSTPGIEFGPAWFNKSIVPFQGIAVFLVSREDLIKSKRAAGRRIDLEDVELLEKIK